MGKKGKNNNKKKDKDKNKNKNKNKNKDKDKDKGKKKTKGRSNTTAEPPKLSNNGSSGSKFKWSCPSERPAVSQTPKISVMSAPKDEEPPSLSLDMNVIGNGGFASQALASSRSPHSARLNIINYNASPSISPRSKSPSGDFAKFAAATTPKSLQSISPSASNGHYKSVSNNNLDNILRRGRKPKRKSSGNNKDENGHRRTRSLSSTREDDSWMSDGAGSSSSDRIKENIYQQKQLDLQALIGTGSKKKKLEIGKLFEKHIEKAKVVAAKGGNEPNTSGLREKLKDEQVALENAVNIVKDLGFLKYIKDNEIYSKIYIKKQKTVVSKNNDDEKEEKKEEILDYDLFDMNNIDVLSKFQGKTRDILTKVICKAITTLPFIEIVEICNCDLDAEFMEIFVDYLCEYYTLRGKDARITILSLQSNPIIDKGMIELCKLIKMNNKCLTTIKLQNNRRDISTLICQQICESLQENEYIIKFEFQFRHYQWRDYRDKVVKRNAEKARLMRLELQKNISV